MRRSLANVPWILSSGLAVTDGRSPPPSATFVDGTVSGWTGCNRFRAQYRLDGAALTIGPIASTKMACPPPADEVERAYLNTLARVARWRPDRADLVVLDGEGVELLRYRAADLDSESTE
jgi:putative lipoprotein